MAAGGGGGGAGLERLRDGRAHAHYEKCVGEPRGATCGVLLAACRFTCVSSGSRSFSVMQQPPPPPHAMAEEEPMAARLQSLVQDQMERELAPLRDQIASLADLLKQKQETGGGLDGGMPSGELLAGVRSVDPSEGVDPKETSEVSKDPPLIPTPPLTL